MTQREFANKYGLPYWLVHLASTQTPTREDNPWARAYPEAELKASVRNEVRKRAQLRKQELEQLLAVLKRLKEE